jgi:hypothetical protein
VHVPFLLQQLLLLLLLPPQVLGLAPALPCG